MKIERLTPRDPRRTRCWPSSYISVTVGGKTLVGRLASRATGDAIWERDVEAGTVWCSEGLRTLFGHSPDQAGPCASWWLDRLQADDRNAAREPVTVARQGRVSGWSSEYRFRRTAGNGAIGLGFVGSGR